MRHNHILSLFLIQRSSYSQDKTILLIRLCCDYPLSQKVTIYYWLDLMRFFLERWQGLNKFASDITIDESVFLSLEHPELGGHGMTSMT